MMFHGQDVGIVILIIMNHEPCSQLYVDRLYRKKKNVYYTVNIHDTPSPISICANSGVPLSDILGRLIVQEILPADDQSLLELTWKWTMVTPLHHVSPSNRFSTSMRAPGRVKNKPPNDQGGPPDPSQAADTSAMARSAQSVGWELGIPNPRRWVFRGVRTREGRWVEPEPGSGEPTMLATLGCHGELEERFSKRLLCHRLILSDQRFLPRRCSMCFPGYLVWLRRYSPHSTAFVAWGSPSTSLGGQLKRFPLISRHRGVCPVRMRRARCDASARW